MREVVHRVVNQIREEQHRQKETAVKLVELAETETD
jgi:hypothetical protein